MKRTTAVIAVGLTLCGFAWAAAPLPKLRVSPDRRFLVKADGTPFFYLGDTAWELFHRAGRAEAALYLDKRASQGYTVIQAVAVAELDGPGDPNSQGHLPFLDRDPARPAVTADYDYWDHVDYIIDEANRRGLYIGLLPTWGRWVVGDKEGRDKLFTVHNAQAYGEFLGRRYSRKGIIWILGGDRTATGFEEIWRAMARGIAIGASGREDYDAVLMSFHPRGAETSSAWFHNDAWLDFNMHQTGHGLAETVKPWQRIGGDYNRTPVKPVMDGEPLYEDHPLAFRARELGYSFDAHVRQRAYWALFSGAFGHTYGNHSVWQMYAPGRRGVNGPLLSWQEALDRPGANQMRHVRALIESRPMLSRVPDQSIVVNPLEGADHIAATRGEGYLFVYTAQGRRFTLNLGKISGAQVRGYWFNPRTGTAEAIGTFENAGTREFIAPAEGFGADWVLVLDDASKEFPAPDRPRGYSIPVVDISTETGRQVVVDREPGQYLGHPTTVLLEDNRTMIAVYPKGHGRGAIVMKRSTDAGLTWSGRLPVPDNWSTSLEVPTIHRVVDGQGVKRLILFSGLYPIRMAVSEDDGRSWSALKPVGDFGGIVVMSDLLRLRDGRYMALFHDDGRFFANEGRRKEFLVYKTLSSDGGLTWSRPEVIARHPTAHLCEPGAVRSPDGRQIAVLLRENSRKRNSFVIFSNDEGATWSEPAELPAALTGDRHIARYAPDGRLLVVFRDTTLESPTKGDWVAWVGRYEDIVQGRQGQYRVRLLDNQRAADCCYQGLELLPGGTFVATTYGHSLENEAPYIVSVRFTLKELDGKLQ